MHHPQTWFALHSAGWFVWLPGAILLGALLLWSRRQPTKRKAVPWMLLALWILMILASYISQGWGQYSYNRALWAGGLAGMVALTLLPLLVGVVIELLATRLKASPLVASASASALAIVAVFFGGFAVAVRTQYWVMTWLMHK